ncbi:MAG: MarR family transcriptional regulator [Anaerolinea sp.]|nr:MarR family transcriptional regulator [Anaerolinea sp.]
MSTDHETTAWQVLRTLPLLMRLVAAEIRQTEHALVPAHLSVLFILSQRACNLSELAEQLAVSLPTMSNTISRLVAAELVTRAPAPQDRRAVQISITAVGLALLHEITTHMVGRIAATLAPLSDADLEAISQGLAALQRAFTSAAPYEDKLLHL